MVFAWYKREAYRAITGRGPQALGSIRRLRHGRFKIKGGVIYFNIVDERGIFVTGAVVRDFDFGDGIRADRVLPLCECARCFIRRITGNKLGPIGPKL